MAAKNMTRVLRAPGRIVINPTNLGDPYPYGGTEVGASKAFVLQSVGTGFNVMSEGLGEVTDVLEQDNRWVCGFMLRGWDDDAVRLLLSDYYSIGSVSKHALLSVPGSNVPGASAFSKAVKLLYVPDDRVNSPALLIYRGVPDWTDQAELAFQRNEELGLPIAIECLRDASNRILAMGRMVDLAL